MTLRDDIVSLFCEFKPPQIALTDETDLFRQCGIDGDDASAFMHSFAERFGVDLRNYLWYFHHGEEGWGLGGLFFPPPYKRVAPIPITLPILVEAATTKAWPIVYPSHRLPNARWDMRINCACSVFLLCIMALGLLAKLHLIH